jgi:phosphatidylglycerol:prolipoprotein diacylglycerol transferase
MIPYVEMPSLSIWGPLAIHPFGLLVVTGCLAGYFVARWHGGTRGLDQEHYVRLTAWTLIPAFLLSHWVTLVLYLPGGRLGHPLQLLDVGNGMSSFGGFLGGAVGATAYLKRNRLPVLEYEDSLLLGLVVGWFFGRLGCSLVHDHPGARTDFFLAVQFPDGPRHDLGLYEWLFTIVLLVILLVFRRYHPPAGAMIGLACVLYAPVRFMLDFLRIGDTLYLGLTPAQYFAPLLFAMGVIVLFRVYRARAA